MQLEFIRSVLLALTLAVRPLEDLENPDLVEQVRSRLEQECGQPSTIALPYKNTFNYVFRVHGYDNSPAPQLLVSVADWQDNLRLSSDGWFLDKSVSQFVRNVSASARSLPKLRSYLQDWLQVP